MTHDRSFFHMLNLSAQTFDRASTSFALHASDCFANDMTQPNSRCGILLMLLTSSKKSYIVWAVHNDHSEQQPQSKFISILRNPTERQPSVKRLCSPQYWIHHIYTGKKQIGMKRLPWGRCLMGSLPSVRRPQIWIWGSIQRSPSRSKSAHK